MKREKRSEGMTWKDWAFVWSAIMLAVILLSVLVPCPSCPREYTQPRTKTLIMPEVKAPDGNADSVMVCWVDGNKSNCMLAVKTVSGWEMFTV